MRSYAGPMDEKEKSGLFFFLFLFCDYTYPSGDISRGTFVSDSRNRSSYRLLGREGSGRGWRVEGRVVV